MIDKVVKKNYTYDIYVEKEVIIWTGNRIDYVMKN